MRYVYGFDDGSAGVRSCLKMDQIFFVKFFSAVKIVNIRLFGDTRRPITAVAYHGFSDMVHIRPLMKSFAGFLQLLVVRKLHEGSWRSKASFFLPDSDSLWV